MNGSGDRRSAPALLLLFMRHYCAVGLASGLFKFQALRRRLFRFRASATAAAHREFDRDEFFSSIEINEMDDFSSISDHSMLLQGHGGMFGAEGCLGIRSPASGVLSTVGKNVPALQDKEDDDMFFSDWPELVGFDDLEASLRNFDTTFEIGSNYFEDILWSSNCSPEEAQLVRNGHSDDIDFSIDRNNSNTLKLNTTKTKQQNSRNGASSSGTASNYDAHASFSSDLSDAELFLPFDDTAAFASQTGGWEGLEAILCSSPEMRVVPAASSTMCTDGSSTCCSSGPDTITALVSHSATKTKARDPFNGAPDTILEEMAENPLDMYFPPLATYEQQPEMLMSDTTSAPKHRFPEEFAGSCALNCAELQFSSEDMSFAGLPGPPGSAVVLDAVPVKDLSFQKLHYGMNQLDLATKGRIRDSLYRLANRLEQRHRVASASEGLGSSSGSNRFETSRLAETPTNPIDQSVAQLLLQKPSYRKTVAPRPPLHRVL